MASEREDDLRQRHRAIVEQQEDLPPEFDRDLDRAERMEAERPREQEEGITTRRRGSRPAPSDRPENEPPHPQDVNEVGERG